MVNSEMTKSDGLEFRKQRKKERDEGERERAQLEEWVKPAICQMLSRTQLDSTSLETNK